MASKRKTFIKVDLEIVNALLITGILSVLASYIYTYFVHW